MLKTLALLLPALIPSWNFFEAIAPSPRLEYALTPAADAPPGPWREFRPRPDHAPLATLLRGLVWNPRWNETLFLVSCAERLIQAPTRHSEDEIFARLAADLARGADGPPTGPWLRFRLVFVHREGEAIIREVRFVSEPRPLR